MMQQEKLSVGFSDTLAIIVVETISQVVHN